MTDMYCIYKQIDNGSVYSYILCEQPTANIVVHYYNKELLINAIKSNRVNVKNLRLTEDNRIEDIIFDDRYIEDEIKRTENMIAKAKLIGGDRLETFHFKLRHATADKYGSIGTEVIEHSYYILHLNQYYHIVYIPDDIKMIISYNSTDNDLNNVANLINNYGISNSTHVLQNTLGYIKFVGGRNLVSIRDMLVDCNRSLVDISTFGKNVRYSQMFNRSEALIIGTENINDKYFMQCYRRILASKGLL